MAPGDLQEVLAVLRPGATPPPADLLVGLGAADDAAVYRLAPDLAIVETVDFFPPVVDDPWTWGAVAAVNAMSDVYAMGGEVMFALAVAGFPRESGAKGATDITGFGFLGHAGEMVKASGAGLAIGASRLPVLPGTRELAEAGQFSGGMKRNRRYVETAFGSALTIAPSVPGYLASLLTESETSGGLLFSVAADRAGSVIDAFKRRGEECWEIGQVLPEPVIRIEP